MSMGTLNTEGVFFLPALAPAVLNVTTITIVLLLVSRVTPPIVAVAIGIAAGGLSQFLFQLPALLRKQYSVRPSFRFGHPGLRKMFLLIVPVILSMSTNQINIFVTNVLASFLPEGSITYLYYAMRLIHFPIGIFGVAMATAVLPTLSRQALAKDRDNMRKTFSFSLRLLFFITLPAMAGLIALRVPIVSTLFQHGRFGADGTEGTAAALLYYSLGIWSMVGMRVAASTFYSMQNTRTPVRIAIAGLLFNILLSIVLMGPMGHRGLALANTLASGLQFTLLLYFLRRTMGSIDGSRLLFSFLKILALSALMGLVGALVVQADIWTESGRAAEKAFRLGLGILACSGLYFGASRIFRSEELDYLLKWRASRRAEGNRNAA